MANWLQYLIPVVVVAAIAIWYVVFYARGGGAGWMQRAFGLAQGEQIYRMYPAQFDPEVSFAEQAGVAAVGLLFGSIATVRGKTLHLVMTSHNRVIFGFQEGAQGDPVPFGPDQRPGIEVVGESPVRLSGPSGSEAASVLRFSTGDGGSFRLLVAASGAQQLVAWSQGADATLPS